MENEYQILYSTHYSDLFLDLISYKIKQNGNITNDDYNSIQRIIVDYFNSGFWGEYIGGKYQIAKLNNIDHYVMKDVIDDSIIDQLYVDNESISKFEKKYGLDLTDKITNLVYSIEDLIYEPLENYFGRRKHYISNCQVLPLFLTDDDIRFKDDFFSSDFSLYYKENFKPRTLKSLLKEKIGESLDLKIIHHKKFSDHYEMLKKTLPVNFNPELENTDIDFKKRNAFVYSDLDFKYMARSGGGTNEEIGHFEAEWLLFSHDDKYSGGTMILNDIFTDVKAISFKKSIENKSNYKKVLDTITSLDTTKKDIFILDSKIIKLGLVDDIRKSNKNKRFYFSEVEKDMLYNIHAFIDKHSLENQAELILNKFYKKVIIKNKNLLLQTDLFDNNINELIIKNFINEILKTYNINPTKDITDRNSFIKYCYINSEKENYLEDYLRYSFNDSNLAFKVDQINSNDRNEIDVYLKVKEFIQLNVPDFPEILYDKLLLDIKKNLQISGHRNMDDYYKEYSYHALYDFLTDNNVLTPKNNEVVTLYRFELSDGQGIYRSDKIEEKLLNKNSQDIFNYAQRKTPSSDGFLSTLFLDPNIRGTLSSNYRSAYIFGFSNKQQIVDWFSQEEISNFNNKGVKLFTYEMNSKDVIQTNIQVAFRHSKEINKKEISINDFFDIKNDKKQKLKI